MSSFTFLFVISVAVASVLAQIPAFDKEYVGVSFSPYVKQWEGDQTPKWDSYSVYDIKAMLRLVGTKFQKIATYSMGVTESNLNGPWSKADANCLIARGASKLNFESNTTLITMAQGIYQNDNLDILNKEIENAFLAADEANKLWPGTVWGLIFTNQYVTDPERGDQILQLIKTNKSKAKEANLKLGVRTHNCGELISGGDAKDSLREIALASDYIMCNIHPPANTVRGKDGVKKSIEAIGKQFFEIQKALHEINPSLEVILGDSGWPSRGVSFNRSPNTPANFKAFWIGIAEWALNNKVQIQIFEAFDEPWKSDVKIVDPDLPGGRFGAEAHFGWWKRLDNYNNNPNSYVEKVDLINDAPENNDLGVEELKPATGMRCGKMKDMGEEEVCFTGNSKTLNILPKTA